MQNFKHEDTPNIRTYDLENGNRLNLKRVDPYGFIYLSLDKGQMPVMYAGAYTDWTSARRAAEGYIATRQSAIAELKDREPKKK